MVSIRLDLGIQQKLNAIFRLPNRFVCLAGPGVESGRDGHKPPSFSIDTAAPRRSIRREGRSPFAPAAGRSGAAAPSAAMPTFACRVTVTCALQIAQTGIPQLEVRREPTILMPFSRIAQQLPRTIPTVAASARNIGHRTVPSIWMVLSATKTGGAAMVQQINTLEIAPRMPLTASRLTVGPRTTLVNRKPAMTNTVTIVRASATGVTPSASHTSFPAPPA